MAPLRRDAGFHGSFPDPGPQSKRHPCRRQAAAAQPRRGDPAGPGDHRRTVLADPARRRRRRGPASHQPHRNFAIATGVVAISNFGKDQAIGISIVGDTVNLAFQIEKLATAETGPILACATTRLMAGDRFDFESLGEAEVHGREGTVRLFALRGRRDGSAAPRTGGRP